MINAIRMLLPDPFNSESLRYPPEATQITIRAIVKKVKSHSDKGRKKAVAARETRYDFLKRWFLTITQYFKPKVTF